MSISSNIVALKQTNTKSELSLTVEQHANCGTLFVTAIADSNCCIKKVLIQGGKNGSCIMVHARTYQEFVNLGLRNNISLDELIAIPKGQFCGKATGTLRNGTSSCVDAISKAIFSLQVMLEARKQEILTKSA